MIKWLCFSILFSTSVLANDYAEGRQFSLSAQSGAVNALSQFSPEVYLNEFTANPAESRLDASQLQSEARKKANQDEASKIIIQTNEALESIGIDINSKEMVHSGHVMENADSEVLKENVPCNNDACLPEMGEAGDDMGEGVSRLGALAGVADEVSANQIGIGNPSIFRGSNHRCRIAVLGLGNCCGGSARLLNCRPEEKALANAIDEKRAVKVGTYCARTKLKQCIEHKESWCVFPSKLAGIIQIQGRFWQLGINFGKAKKKTNAANCRGITPEELERINFQLLDLTSIAQEIKAKAVEKTSQQLHQQSTQKIETMEREGRAYD